MRQLPCRIELGQLAGALVPAAVSHPCSGAGLTLDSAFAARTELLAGQCLDMLTQASGDETPEAALRVDRHKTAAYTVERPLHLGAANGNPH